MLRSLVGTSTGGGSGKSDPARSALAARLRESMGPGLEGIELRALSARESVSFGTFLLTRFGLPWVPLVIEPVDEVEMPSVVRHDLEKYGLLRPPAVEAAFIVAIDPSGRWRVREIEATPTGA